MRLSIDTTHKYAPDSVGKTRFIIDIRKVFLICLFFIFLHPYSISLGGDGLSANYSFVLLPLFYFLLRRGVIRRPQKIYLLFMGLYSIIFVVASIYQLDLQEYSLRRTISFFLFMTIFSFMFMKIDAEMVAAFKLAIVGISVYFSLYTISTYFSAGGAALGALAKTVVGSQRFGFIYILAIWLVYQEKYFSRLWPILKYPVLFILLSGLLMTFSRSGIVALLGSFGIFTVVNVIRWFRRPTHTLIRKAIVSISILSVLIIAVVLFLPGTVEFFDQRLFSYFLNNSAVADDISNPEASEGYRIFMIQKILGFVANNPLTGSGYLGVWILFSDHSGSAHNQYSDVLFRTGLPGFVLYLYLLFILIKFLYTNERALFWGTLGVLIYGLFHETFKESQGAFVLTFLLGMLAQRRQLANYASRRTIERSLDTAQEYVTLRPHFRPEKKLPQ